MKIYEVSVYAVVLIVALFLISTIISNSNHKGIDNAEEEAEQYCKMVYEGHWPDYQQNYDKFCNGPKWNGK